MLEVELILTERVSVLGTALDVKHLPLNEKNDERREWK